MQKVSLFSLELHQGPYEKWPLRTRLFVDGNQSETKVPGYVLLHQFQTDFGYLLITDCDCPFEETTNFILLDKKTLKVLSCKQFFVPYGTFLLDSFEWLNEHQAKITFYDDDCWLLTLKPKGISFISSQIQIKRIE